MSNLFLTHDIWWFIRSILITLLYNSNSRGAVKVFVMVPILAHFFVKVKDGGNYQTKRPLNIGDLVLAGLNGYSNLNFIINSFWFWITWKACLYGAMGVFGGTDSWFSSWF